MAQTRPLGSEQALSKIEHKLAELINLTDVADMPDLRRRLIAASDEARRLRPPSDPPMVPDL